MLKKLFRYDFRCIGRLSGPCIIGMVASSLLSILFFWLIWITAEHNAGILPILGMMGMLVCIIVLFLFAAAPALINYFHFAKNLYFDEGYLTMTLPANEHQLLLSKLFAGFLWLVIDFVAAAISSAGLFFGIFQIIGLPLDLPIVLPELPTISVELVAAVLCFLLYMLVYAFFELVLGMTVITLGCLMMPKHKILGILLFYILSNWIVSIVNQMITLLCFNTTTIFPGSTTGFSCGAPLTLAAITAGLTVLCYFFMHRMLKKSINLE